MFREEVDDNTANKPPGAPIGYPGRPTAPLSPPAPNPPGVNTGPVGRPPGPFSDPYENEKAARGGAWAADAPTPAPAAAAAAPAAPAAVPPGVLPEGPFSKAIMQQMDDELLRASKGQIASGRRTIDSDVVRRGLSRSGIPVSRGEDLERGVLSDLSAGMRKARSDAALANYSALKDEDRFNREMGLKENQFAFDKEMASRPTGGGGGERAPQTIQLTNPDGTITEVPLEILGMLTGME